MPRAARVDDRVILIVAVALTILLAGATVLLAPPATPGLRGSSLSARADGAKAAVVLLKQLGYRVQASFDPLVAIQADPKQTILVVTSPSPSRHPSNQDRRALRRFVEDGGIVLAAGVGEGYLPDLTGVPTPALDMSESKPLAYRAALPSPLTRGAASIRIAPEVIAVSNNETYLPIYVGAGAGAGAGAGTGAGAGAVEDHASAATGAADAGGEKVEDAPAGDAGVLTRQLGAGRIVWWIGSAPLLNRGIEEPGHLELLLNTLGDPGGRTVLWDEYYHGYGRGFASYLAGTPLVALFAQLALMGALALFTLGRRRAPIRPPAVEPRASAMEFVEAMAALYQKARAAGGAVETGRVRLRRLLTSTAQLPAGSADDRLAAAIAARHPGVDARELTGLLEESAAASGSNTLAGGAALTLVQRLHAVADTVQHAGQPAAPRAAQQAAPRVVPQGEPRGH
jgi:hypothetical protein